MGFEPIFTYFPITRSYLEDNWDNGTFRLIASSKLSLFHTQLSLYLRIS
jgi:hypothetical protein